MPGGKRHAIACFTVAGAAFGSLFAVCGWQPAVACALGALLGIPLTPDLDLVTSSYQFRKYCGWIPERLWYAVLWAGYRKVCKHRGIWSHGPVISTAIRLCYLGVVPTMLWMWAGLPAPSAEVWMLWALLGLVVSDATHSALDWCDSKLGGRL